MSEARTSWWSIAPCAPQTGHVITGESVAPIGNRPFFIRLLQTLGSQACTTRTTPAMRAIPDDQARERRGPNRRELL
jgi:hypothetical protein